jgi:hypothetical protein
MKQFLSSKYTSLGCSVINGVFAIGLLSDHNWILAGICVLASGYCFGNYVKAKDE